MRHSDGQVHHEGGQRTEAGVTALGEEYLALLERILDSDEVEFLLGFDSPGLDVEGRAHVGEDHWAQGY